MARRRGAMTCAPNARFDGATRLRFAHMSNCWSYHARQILPRGLGRRGRRVVIVLAGVGYGVVKGDHVPALLAALNDARDAVGNAAGFRIVVDCARRQPAREPRGNSRRRRRHRHHFVALPRRGAGAQRLKSNPWIADATRSQALSRRAADRHQGTCGVRTLAETWTRCPSSPTTARCSSLRGARLVRLPFVVGSGAEARAKEFLAAARSPSRDARPRARVDAGRRAALEHAAAERHRRAAAGRRCRRRARRGWSRSTATRTTDDPRHRQRSICACPTA